MFQAARRIVRRIKRFSVRQWFGVLFVVIFVALATYGAVHSTHTASAPKQNAVKTAKKQPTKAKKKSKSSATTTPTTTPQTTSPPSTPVTQGDQLTSIVNTWRGQYSFGSAVTVLELTGSKRAIHANSTTRMVPASTYKIYVAYAILHGVEQGRWTLGTTLSDGHTIQADLENMILNSNNDAARALGFYYDWNDINSLIWSIGISRQTNLYNYVPPSTEPIGNKYTTSDDLAAMLQKIYEGSVLNQSHTSYLIGLLKQQRYRERIPAGVPSSVAVADKPGWLSPVDGYDGYVQNDAAIVYGPKSTYILVITTSGSSTQPLTALSQQVYGYLQQ